MYTYVNFSFALGKDTKIKPSPMHDNRTLLKIMVFNIGYK